MVGPQSHCSMFYVLCLRNFLAICLLSVFPRQAHSIELKQLMSMSLEELMHIRVATLTDTDDRYIPAAVTHISAEQIRLSGARSLNELLERFVPGVQYIYHNFGGPTHLGVRGIMGDLEDKYLLQVNGRSINEHTTYGAITERDLSLMADINHIDIVRGPGSAVHGLGAVSMSINITTKKPQNSNNQTEFRTRGGFVERFFSQELSKTGDINDDIRYSAYAGISQYTGAKPEDSPLRYATSFQTKLGESVIEGKDVTLDIGNDRQAYRDRPKLKFHLELSTDDWNAWARYTRGGEDLVIAQPNLAATPVGRDVEGSFTDGYPPVELGYQQFIIAGTARHRHNEQWLSTFDLSFDIVDIERNITLEPENPGIRFESHREDKFMGRWLVRNNAQKSIRTRKYLIRLKCVGKTSYLPTHILPYPNIS